LLPGLRRKRVALDRLEEWAKEASEANLLVAVGDQDPDRRRLAVIELCARDPDRCVKPIAAAARQRVGGKPRPEELPDAAELLELDLAFCDCRRFGSFELLSPILEDSSQDYQLRVRALLALAGLADPRALAAVRAAAHSPDPRIRRTAQTTLNALAAYGWRSDGDD
jgi:HEAT repeat protein